MSKFKKAFERINKATLINTMNAASDQYEHHSGMHDGESVEDGYDRSHDGDDEDEFDHF